MVLLTLLFFVGMVLILIGYLSLPSFIGAWCFILGSLIEAGLIWSLV